ncbi:hypothetical protein CDQ84_11015 [Clostridium thermosuccinogenes]|jgi:hypothetical protein|uniref:DUF2975 domain-containing protein n=1 Tax=Clostridium thermosuccinogenes TaxID=84032 RepID=A0A2K2FD17_9CLOT|nr:hypothetical protein [Pseudoclostridium thermosuccinogenes]AUS97071.1 hypothetical protein CDO33_11850 [Pseudoclostridium thermosuccinogenes]PNT96681.1 hypothetical protein CDQ85_10860 [Pseudoclostridium thermosuccinogenes]PNT98475.1 hypothetical protein CDQ84_11015 [Pseudoclostridium thermosuccinogenes]
MKHKKLCVFLACEAVLCILLHSAREILPRAFTAVMAFPFEQIGLGLRALSLSGDTGNIISIVLYTTLCLIPVGILYSLKRVRRLYPEDALLAVLSIVLFAVVYMMINPGLLGPYFGDAAGQSVTKAVLGGMVYSVLIGYAVLRILRLFFHADTGRLQKYLEILLCALNALFVYLAFGAYFSSLMDSFDALRSRNTGNEQSLGMSYLFLVLQYVVNALPYILDVLVVFAALELLDELSADRYSEAAVNASEKLSRLCGMALAVIVISNIGFNLLQLVFIKMLAVMNGSVQIPLISVAFTLAVLLLAQYIKENKQLKDDNDMFI